ncbi:MAG: type II secretion system F family protein [Candidatus Omnitrophota bacterium]
MPVYDYGAKDQAGQNLKGTIEASDRKTALNKLRAEKLVIISFTEKASVLTTITAARAKVKPEDVVIFSRQLATMLDAGIPILNSLEILADQADSKKFREVLAAVKRDIEVGSSLSGAFGKHPRVFSPLYVSMVRAGETSGMLDDILDRLAMYLEKTAALQRKVKSALVYPAAVTSMALLITVVLLVKVIPVFKDVFSGFGAELPTPTLILINISDVVRKYYIFVAAALGCAAYALHRYILTDKGRFQFDRILLRLPVFGVLFTKVAVGKFSRTLSSLVKSGVPILSSLEVVAKTCGNKVFEEAVNKVRSAIREGENIAVPLEKCRIFPPMVVKMIAVGEQTGQLEKMLSKIADFYEEQVDVAVSGLTSLIEPLIIAFLGIVIGGVVICMFLPIFKLSSIVNM